MAAGRLPAAARLLLTGVVLAALCAATLASADGHHGEQEHHEAEGHADHAAEEEHEGHSHGITQADYEVALARGEDPCANGAIQSYDLPLHIGSVFILLGVSLLGALSPVALRLSSSSDGVSTAIKLGTYFGFGTILSTAFIHMMLPAAESLSSPCLPASFTQSYEAWAYLFVTLAVMVMHLVDYLIKGYYMRREARQAGGGGEPAQAHEHKQQHQQHHHTHSHGGGGGGGGCQSRHTAIMGALLTKDLQAKQQQEQQQVEAAEGGEANQEEGNCPVHGEGCNSLLKHSHDASQVVGIYLTEAGIIFHSVMIGLTLGVTAGPAFKTLLVALSFHQFFEGFAIGSAAVDSGIGVVRSSVMGAAYAVTTPIGIAIGIGVRETFNQNAARTLLVSGIFDSFSTGILIYVVLVELITPMMTDSAWLRSRSTRLQVAAFAAFYAGAGAMAAVGKWA